MKVFIKNYAGFKIYFEALPEFEPIESLLPDHSALEILEVIKSNVVFVAKVSAEKAGIELASDILGGCMYGSEKEFYTTCAKDYFEGMCDTVTEAAKDRLVELINELEK